MRTLKTGLVALLASFMLTVWFGGCRDNDHPVSNDTIAGSGVIISQNRTPGSFSGIRIVGVAKVYIRQDAAESLRIEADDNIIDHVSTTVNQGVLVVGLTNGSYSSVTVHVYATMENFRSIEITGTGDCVATNALQSDDVTCTITGAGSITLSGAATRQTIVIAGSGNVRNFGLTSDQCSATILGTGNIEIHVSQQLDAVIAGVGSITYDGDPEIVRQTTSGVGSIQPR